MFGKITNRQLVVKSSPARKAAPSVLSADMNILGNIISEGFVDVDGRIEGNIKCFSVTVRRNGVAKGDIFADTVHVYGEVHGLIRARSVHLFSGCRVEGVIMHESLSIEDGAFVDGKFKRTDKIFAQEDDGEGGAVSAENHLKVLENLRLIS